jgi:hypothetical protein
VPDSVAFGLLALVVLVCLFMIWHSLRPNDLKALTKRKPGPAAALPGREPPKSRVDELIGRPTVYTRSTSSRTTTKKSPAKKKSSAKKSLARKRH